MAMISKGEHILIVLINYYYFFFHVYWSTLLDVY